METEKPNKKRTILIAKMIKLSGKKQKSIYDAFEGGKVGFWRKRKDNAFTEEDENNISTLLNGAEALKAEIRQKAETKRQLRQMIKALWNLKAAHGIQNPN